MLREGREPLAGAKEEYSFYLKLGAGTLGAGPESPCLTGSQGTGAEAGDSTEGNQEEEQQCSVTEKPKTVCDEPKGRTCPWVLGTALEDLIRPRRTGVLWGEGPLRCKAVPPGAHREKRQLWGRASSSTRPEIGGLGVPGPPYSTSGRPEGSGKY